ncbi:hypothetical protein B0T26DRAFT_147419 [Lasiosphaeria miniovina]|uniref:Uncharacterized protein n=1 Tax=Lasiosphaeria miniovina TaxID=1954250 RepID=A0AA40B552_9PEZI|nr:uncharacterized protein B0T26DRAFT_147419 [Lasiosphaeria miniovina]KAK0727860.1 hypothetical protein B0T26DRAFT_147419 [Lasiosphaeria miniovina]
MNEILNNAVSPRAVIALSRDKPRMQLCSLGGESMSTSPLSCKPRASFCSFCSDSPIGRNEILTSLFSRTPKHQGECLRERSLWGRSHNRQKLWGGHVSLPFRALLRLLSFCSANVPQQDSFSISLSGALAQPPQYGSWNRSWMEGSVYCIITYLGYSVLRQPEWYLVKARQSREGQYLVHYSAPSNNLRLLGVPHPYFWCSNWLPPAEKWGGFWTDARPVQLRKNSAT